MARVVLVRLAADEPVEVLEPAAASATVERPHRAGLPDRHLVALAELGGAVAVEQQGLGQRRRSVRAHRAVARGRRRDLGDGAHADGVVVAAGQQRLPGGRTERGRVEAGELQALRREPLGVRRAGTGRRTRSTHRSRRRRAGRPARSAPPPAAAAARSAGTPCPGPWRRTSSNRASPDAEWATPNANQLLQRPSRQNDPPRSRCLETGRSTSELALVARHDLASGSEEARRPTVPSVARLGMLDSRHHPVRHDRSAQVCS